MSQESVSRAEHEQELDLLDQPEGYSSSESLHALAESTQKALGELQERSRQEAAASEANLIRSAEELGGSHEDIDPAIQRIKELESEKVTLIGEAQEQIVSEAGAGQKLPEQVSLNSDKQETRRFSKEYSPAFRKRLAEEIVAMRKKYREEIPRENEERAEKRTEKESEFKTYQEEIISPAIRAREEHEKLTNLRDDWILQKEELDAIETALDRKKSSFWNNLLKGKQLLDESIEVASRRMALPQEISAEEIEQAKLNHERRQSSYESLARYSKERFDEDLSKIQEIAIDDAWAQKAKDKIESFYADQEDIRREYESTRADRGIAENSAKHKVLFLHGMPFGEEMANTVENNASLSASKMTGEEKALFMAGLEPTISVASKTLDPELLAKLPKSEVMYKTGFVLGGGEILSAYKDDAGTMGDSLTSRYSKYDSDAASSVQTNISQNIEGAVTSAERKFGAGRWNEFVVRNPKISALYIYDPTNRGYFDTLEGGKDTYLRLLKIAEKLGVPVVGIDKSGKIENLLEARRPMSAEELTGDHADFTPEERAAFVQEGYKSEYGKGETNDEIKHRLSSFEEEFSDIDQTLLMKRRYNSELARERFEVLSQAA